MKLTSYGAAREVTGSNHVLEINGKKIAIDCGMFQGHRVESERKNQNFAYDPSTVDAVILTHAHCDHCGRLPLMCGNGLMVIYTQPLRVVILPDLLCQILHT